LRADPTQKKKKNPRSQRCGRPKSRASALDKRSTHTSVAAREKKPEVILF
jgi:hypothetical protein